MHVPRPHLAASRLSRVTLTLLALLALVVPAVAAAQNPTLGTVAGRITDAADQRPLGGAYVVVAGSQQGVAVREDGTYRLLLRPGTYELRARLIGYGAATATVTVAAGATTTQDFALPRAVVNLGEVAVVGTRAAERTVTDAPVPIDVIGPAELQATGVTETNQAIQMIAPSFNFPRPSISDGTDHVRPSTLRGLGPDQVLVLVNGKRRHNSALVNVNGTVGRGSTGVDLNAIPLSAIERIEILRDGAAAQYGSDAIAGVINIVLKSEAKTDGSLQVGRTYATDGETFQLGGSHGLGTEQGSFLNLAGELRHRGYTNRANVDTVTPFFPGDPRNSQPQHRNVLRWRHGDGIMKEGGLFANGGVFMANGVQLYGFGGSTLRFGDSPANFRRPNNNGTVRALYPLGFLPHIESTIWDISAGGGLKGVWNAWNYDLSTLYGGNRFRYDVTNSNNASLGTASPRDFYAGTMIFSQHVTNFDASRTVSFAGISEVNVATGAELRFDRYKIWDGDRASWVHGGVPVLDGPNAGAIAAAGTQGFPGFQPSDATNEIRNNVAAYIDFEGKPAEQFTLSLAGRAERYSDFGSAVTGKIASRFEFVPGFAVRAAVGNGFRAPSLQQEYFSSTATNFIGGVPYDIKTFPATSGAAAALGARPLEPEKSINISAGVTAEPTANLSLTADYYGIEIDDRIVFSENFTTAAVRNILAAQGFPTIGGGRFFTNAIDTRTRGLDLVARYGFGFGSRGTLRLTGSANWTKTEVTRVSPAPSQLVGLDEVLFGRIERTRIERGQPRRTMHLNADYSIGSLSLAAHHAYFGDVTAGTNFAGSYVEQGYDGAWITDASIGYRLRDDFQINFGANNIFDVYPDDVIPAFSNSGVLRYPVVSPWGFNGGYYYTKLVWNPGR